MVEVVDQGEDFLVLKSPASGALYAVVFEIKRKGEEARIAPLSAWLSKGAVVMSAGAADSPAKPAAKPAAKPKVRKVRDARPASERGDQLVRLLKEHGPMTVPELNEKIGRESNDTGLYSTVRSLNNNGLVLVEEIPRVAEDGRTRKVRIYSVPPQANEPIGPVSQRESEPSQASSNDGL